MLTLKYRPRTFGDVEGQPQVSVVLSAIARHHNGPPPAAMIFAGPRGTGKTSSARVFAAGLNCEDQAEDGSGCMECSSCVDVVNGASVSVIEVDAASNGLVADVRAMRDRVSYSHPGDWRVVVFDEAHSMSREAYNALLKMLEEPPERTTFVLVTTEPDKIPDTVASRSMRLVFRRLTALAIARRLSAIADSEGFEVDTDMLAAIAVRAEGGMRDGVMLLDQAVRAGVETVEQLHEMVGASDAGWDLLERVVKSDRQGAFEVIDGEFYRVGDATGMVESLVSAVTALVRVRAGVQDPSVSGARRKRLTAMSEWVSTATLTRSVRVLWEVHRRIRSASTVDQRGTMEMCVVLLLDVFATVESSSSPEPPAKPVREEGSDTMSLEEMRRVG